MDLVTECIPQAMRAQDELGKALSRYTQAMAKERLLRLWALL